MQNEILKFVLKKRMSENSDIKGKLSEFFRYHLGRMTERERNAFERGLQKDPFTEDALKGYEHIDQADAEEDIESLLRKLKTRTTVRQRNIWYRVAAAAAILVIISSVFLLTEKNRPRRQISYNQVQEIKEEKTQTPAKEKNPENLQGKKPAAEPKNVTGEKRSEPVSSEKKAVRAKEPAVAAVESPDAAMAAKAVEPENHVLEPLMKKVADTGVQPDYLKLVRGKVVSAEDDQPLPGVRISIKGTDRATVTDASGNFDLRLGRSDTATLIANYVGMKTKEFRAESDSSLEVKMEPSVESLSEIVTVGYESARKEMESGYSAPQPVTGKSEFDKYIKNNLRRPDSLTAGQRVVVVLGLEIRSDGKIDSIAVIRSPSEVFSKEAIRLIREGPAWKAAEMDGKPIDDDVRVRIIFR
jgi:hypothetical protein